MLSVELRVRLEISAGASGTTTVVSVWLVLDRGEAVWHSTLGACKRSPSPPTGSGCLSRFETRWRTVPIGDRAWYDGGGGADVNLKCPSSATLQGRLAAVPEPRIRVVPRLMGVNLSAKAAWSAFRFDQHSRRETAGWLSGRHAPAHTKWHLCCQERPPVRDIQARQRGVLPATSQTRA
ncbi:hypothetical protein SAMD00023353_6200200 [Rosellinia necatrix]|uniref:Uncharacterized protein n=1 Tax=Rosellinia necatrix TaxID=77044 RepID=A0A1S8AAC8_ROSNE|nr:hypothetical protein SAMD00023353_6200200 [Rosellinia necatrix]